MLWIALTVRFLLELAMLGAYGYWAAQTVEGGWRWPAAIALPLAVATVWGLFLSPKARFAPPAWGQFLLEAALFGGAAAALWSTGHPVVAVAGLAIWLADRLAIMALGGMPRQ